MQSVRIIDLPGMKMVSSGVGMFGDGKLERFAEWFSALPQGLYPEDFLCGNEQGMFWLFPYRSGMDIGAFELVDFQGGLYAVATDIDQRTDTKAMRAQVDAFLEENGLTRDQSRWEMGHILTSDRAAKILGYYQMDYFTPVKPVG